MKKWQKLLVILFVSVILAAIGGAINNNAEASGVSNVSISLALSGSQHRAEASANVVTSGAGIRALVIRTSTGQVESHSNLITGNAGIRVFANSPWRAGGSTDRRAAASTN